MSSKAERVKKRHEKVLSMYRGYINELERAYKSHYDRRVAIKLDEWRQYCDWIRKLPYSEFITMEKTDV